MDVVATSSQLEAASQASFSLSSRLPIFTYLVATERTLWYRALMRIFWQHHHERYEYQLAAETIRDEMRAHVDADYTLDQCENDLRALQQWGNLSAIFDTSRAHSIAAFRSQRMLYQATPEAIAIETFVAQQLSQSRPAGALRQGDMLRLWEALQRIDGWLALPEADQPAGRDIAETWLSTFEIWSTMAREVAQYLAQMIRAAQASIADIAAFQTYKNAVIDYVQGFAQALATHADRFRHLFAQWDADGQRDRLIAIVAPHLDPPTLEARRSLDEMADDIARQLDAMAIWFAPGHNTDAFRSSAMSEVQAVVRRAHNLAANVRPGVNFATTLNALATQLMQQTSAEDAAQIFGAAFAHVLPLHLPESLIGPASARSVHERESGSWHDTPAASIQLPPVRAGNRGNRIFDDPMPDHSSAIQSLVVRQQEREATQREQLERLFATDTLAVGNLPTLAPAERALLLDLIDRCLGAPDHGYRAADRSLITLLNPGERRYSVVRAHDGVVILPRYRLRRQVAVPVGATRQEALR